MRTPELSLGSVAAPLLSRTRHAGATHALYPLTGAPRLLVPMRSGRAAAASVRHYTTPSSAKTRALLRLGAGLARVGVIGLAPRGVALGGPGTFLDHIQDVLGQKLFVGVHFGPPRANRKPVLHFMDRHGRSIAYAKLGVNDLTCRRVRAESEALKCLSVATLPGLVTPALLNAGTWNGLDYLVMGPVATWSTRRAARELRLRASAELVGAFPRGASKLQDAPWWSRILAALEVCGADAEGSRLLRAATQLASRHGDQIIKYGAAHGDWSPWNMSARSDALVVWDWERFAPDVPVGWDELHFTIAAHPGGAAAALSDPRKNLLGQSRAGHPAEREVVLAAYLLDRAVNFIRDGQLAAGAPNGPLHTWLLPALDDLVKISSPT